MANQEENFEPSPHFFKLFLPQNTDHGRTQLKLPSSFVKEHGNSLSKYACLQVPTGAITWKVELKRRERRVWLHKGWQEFVEYYSIKFGYFLMFRYEGESCFRVFVFDTTTLETEYPVEAASTSCKRVELDQSKLIQIKDEDTDDDDHKCLQNLYQSKEKSYAKQSSEVRSQHSRSAWDKVLQRAKAFKSPNPCFIVRIQPYHVCVECCLYIPKYARRHFLEKGNNGIYLKLGEDERAWFVKYSIDKPPQSRVRLASGYSIFMRENHLQVGDVCVFELINSTAMEFKVTIFRIADYA